MTTTRLFGLLMFLSYLRVDAFCAAVFFFFDAMKWHQRCFHVIFNKNVYMYVCPTFSSIPCQTFISAFLPPPSIIFSHITHVIQSKMTCSHWGEERRRGDKRWVLFSVLGEIPSFSRTDEEETNSTIHSLPFTKKKNIFRTSSFRLLVGQTAVAAATRLHIIYTNQCHGYIQCYWGEPVEGNSWTALGNQHRHTKIRREGRKEKNRETNSNPAEPTSCVCVLIQRVRPRPVLQGSLRPSSMFLPGPTTFEKVS